MMLLLMLMIMATMVHAQDTQYASITIGGSVYGGGNAGNTGGSTSVTVRAGEIGSVFGGARMANVGGSAFVNIDGEHASDDILITSVYGGNDIAGTIGSSTKLPEDDNNTLLLDHTPENNINNTWNAFVRTSRSSKIDNGKTVEDKAIIIGTLYGGGNGDYDYTTVPTQAVENPYYGLVKPELGKTYLEIMGGCIAHLYGGGNNATVTGNTTIYINNSSDELNKTVAAWAAAHDNLTQQEVIAYLINKVKLPTFQSNLTSFAYNFSRVFGGNNKAPMAIRPKWNLQKGVIRDLYSGGNQGAMTYEKGIYLPITPTISDDLKIENVFGGCRMADVNPGNAQLAIEEETIDGTYFPAGYSARLMITGGDINNVYGGNDISGNIYGGNAVGIHSSIKGDVYGGGNGSYAYTDNKDLATSDLYGDFYYNVKDILGLSDNGFTGAQSVEALNIFRPNAEAVSVRLVGTKEKPTIIGGAVFCGGNSATLRNDDPDIDAAAELKIGSYVIADKVFLGNNGEKMKDTGILERYAKSVDASGNIVTSGGYDFSQMDLASESKTNGQTQFDIYMDGVTMDIMPRVVFDDVGAYVPYSTYFGSFYCGGNVGSMRRNGAINISFTNKVVIFEKVVGGSNEANVYQSAYNAQYLGGLLGNPDDDGNKLILNFNGLKIEPRRWNSTYAVLDENEEFVVGNKYYTSALGDGEFTATSSTTKKEGTAYYKLIDRGSDLVWNTVSASSGNNVEPVTLGSGNSNAYDLDRRLKGGNIYGGCYSNGHVEGNVVINLNASIHERDKLFDVVSNEGDILYENVEKAEENASYYNISQRNTGVILSQQGMDVLGAALNVFGGGYGGDSEIWGSTTINLNAGYTFQIFGGGEMGTIGKAEKYNETTKELEYDYNSNYSTYINLNGAEDLPGVARDTQGDDANMAECEFIYGGAFEGLICGDTHINLNNGRIFNTFAGSCNADILGHTETYVGQNGFPWVRDHLYGGNDLGGSILGEADFLGRIRDEVKGMVADAYKNQISKAASYMEYTQGRVGRIFGGSFGDYDYINDFPTITKKPYLHNSFVNIRPNTDENNEIEKVFGAGEGYPGNRDGDKAQDHSYVLIDIPDGVENFVNTEVFGAGAYNGLGMKEFLAPQTKPAENASEEELEAYNAYETALDEVSAITDLMRGRIGAAYGGSYKQGVTRRTMVNVPRGSTIKIGSIFGGAYGSEIFEPCDVYEANVNYHSRDAYLIYNPIRTDEKTGEKLGNKLQKGAIYGGNNQERRTLYGKINIDVPVKQKHYKYEWSNATVYGAGCGSHTWSEYTEVNLNAGAEVWEVYGGGEAGGVFNAESAQAYIKTLPDGLSSKQWIKAWTLGSGYDDGTFGTGENSYETNTYAANTYTNLSNPLVRVAEIDDRAEIASTDTKHYKRYNTNVIIHKGAYVGNYAYGGGYGYEGDAYYGSGDVYGTTYIALLGGIVSKDIYAAGTSGAVYNLFGADFTASTNAYIAGGMLRNVYGGGWKGDVGYTTMTVSSDGKTATFDDENEKPGETHVVIGIRPDQTDDNLVAELNKVLGKEDATKSDYGFYAGEPAIQRNAYGGGEGGAVYGSSYLTINNGYIGYVHLNAGEMQNEQGKVVAATETTTERYEEKIHDETYKENNVWQGANRLKDCGNLFGGGYDVKSSVDFSHITLWNGTIRNSVYGGGEIATIGRGAIEASGPSNSIRTLKGFYKAGKTNIEMYNGHVLHNVFGGGKGYNLFGYGQQGTLYMDGYVFGQTEVHIHGGEIGTSDGVADGYGNVFGAGDIGFVWSKGYNDPKSRKTNTTSPGHTYYYFGDNLIEDCKVVIAPELQVKTAGTIGNHTYSLFDYVSTDDLNLLPKKNADKTWLGGWEKLYTEDGDGNDRGIIIHNAVFAGGNVSSNNDQSYAKSKTVFGNTTATLYDVYHRDFITVGTEHTGGLYGGGNLSLVDGYRELNITNYGTDYYGLESTIDITTYRGLSNRERAYFQLMYECTAHVVQETVNGESKWGVKIGDEFYAEGQQLEEEKYLKLIAAYPDDNVSQYWQPYGFCSIYAGRLLNTIQSADFCGVYGSRMVLQGAIDREALPDEEDKNDEFTINRVGEVSLNKKKSLITADSGEDAEHGNYFGIYNRVKYMGNLTSDIRFGDKYIDPDGVEKTDGTTFYSYKASNYTNKKRNKGTSINQVALASGVYLELTTENSTTDHKDYGLITGVVGLDLINVKTKSEGGGFVYAKNEHRVPKYYPDKTNVLLSEYNMEKKVDGVEIRDEARTYKRYRYSLDDAGDWSTESTAYVISGDVGNEYKMMPYQTSGNFIHKKKDIIDDCYPTNNAYDKDKTPYSEAHYWYVKGEVYIYDQTVVAHTGSATAYSKEVPLPLTMTAASNGKLQLLNVKPNLYAYYTYDGNTKKKLGSEEGLDKVTVNNESASYALNDVITWWDWHQLSYKERECFVTETYVNSVACIVDNKSYAAGTYVMNQADFDSFKSKSHTILNSNGEMYKDKEGNDIGLSYVFRSSNNISHESGYVLTLDMNSPKKWDDWYSPATGASTYTVSGNTVTTTRITKEEYESRLAAAETPQTVQNAWREGPTFTPRTTGTYGKRHYTKGDIVTKETRDNAAEGKDYMEEAYVAKESVTYTYGTTTKTVNAGAAISATEYEAIGSAQSSFAPAKVCTSSLRISDNNYMLYGRLYYEGQINDLKEVYEKNDQDIDEVLTPAYICTQDGDYGGQTLENGKNYGAIQAWCALPKSDRIGTDADTGEPYDKFTFNYDALDLLSAPSYLEVKVDENSSPSETTTVAAYHAPYTDQTDVEYKAVFHAKGTVTTMNCNGQTLSDGDQISHTDFETYIRNDKRHYTRVSVKTNGETVYFANKNFIYNGTPYGKGQVVDVDIYNANTSSVDKVTFGAGDAIRYYCYEDYTKADNSTVKKGTTISQSVYEALTNDQQYFVIQGMEPTERTTLYVSSESNALDVTKERIYTVVYQYTYYEDEDDGGIKMTNELHVINIHLKLESGVPQIGQLSPPPTVLPGNVVGLSRPDVKPGLYDILTNGWMLFTNEDDAINHRNGIPFVNNGTPVYWYQNQQNWVAFYSQTWEAGETYSNPVPLSVANYHDLDKVMNDKEHHLYVDKSSVERPCKIYIDNRECESDETKSELDLLKDFYDLSLLTSTSDGVANGKVAADGALKDHALLNSHVRAGRNLEFFLNSNVSPKKYVTTYTTTDPETGVETVHNDGPGWTPIGNDNTTGDTGQCFDGNLHGDGYTISGLNNSLFAHLCGEVYNLGVTGSFTGAGIAEEGSGYVENCWVKTTGTPVTTGEGTHYAVFGNPSRAEDDNRGQIQVENCYYPASNTYADASSSTHGMATQMPDKAFYNGEVAYNLNSFYLHKRYYHGTNLGEGTNNTSYKYLQPNDDGTLPDDMSTGYYPNGYAIYQPDVKVDVGETKPYMGYVESRFYDGDYRYAGGTIPESSDIRMRTVTVGEGDHAVTTPYYVPIWPDDYIFFGQTLNYGYGEDSAPAHQDLPSHINKNNERLQTDASGNRVYRAPAYYGNSEMQTAYFNPNAVFAQADKNDPTKIAYKNMTAIDFTGYNDETYKEGLQQDGKFYPPLLDDDGLTGFRNVDLTQNLLAYAPPQTTNAATHDVLDNYFGDLTCNEQGDDVSTIGVGKAEYRRVASVTVYEEQSVRGHVVFQTDGNTYIADRDHFLVDRNDFYCPIPYKFTEGSNGTLMWYQRKPDNFVGMKKEDGTFTANGAGWEAVSLPFTAELVTTQDKGELTHFYQGSTKGHEYWLREYKGKADETSNDATIFIANMSKPNASSDSNDSKEYTNTFLWDYYYSKDSYLDKNEDEYQKTYYSEAHTYSYYPYSEAGTPYIIGLPGERYYEFDLSGEWSPANRYNGETIASPGRQNVTFVSATGISIANSDTDMGKKATGDGYSFMPCYTTKDMEIGKAYLLNSEGSSFDKNTEAATTVPFRPYFTGSPSNTRSIVFGNEQEELKGEAEHGDPKDGTTGTLRIWAKKDKIFVESTLSFTEDVRVVTPAGITVATATVKSGQTVEVQADFSGMYIVHTLDGLYTKKVVVKK